MAPFTWSWALGAPKELTAEVGAHAHVMYDPAATFTSAFTIVDKATLLDCAFGPCPEGAACRAGSSNLTYADLQVHPGSDLRQRVMNVRGITGVGPSWATGAFTLEEIPEKLSSWRRGISWGIGSCSFISAGSYSLTKIIDADGAPLEPNWSKFLKYMGDTPLFLWTG